MKQNSISTTNGTTNEKEIAKKIKAVFKCDWINVGVQSYTTQIIMNWDSRGMKMIDNTEMNEVEQITGRKFDTMAIHSSKCISLIFYGKHSVFHTED
jgi:hypothetical protein